MVGNAKRRKPPLRRAGRRGVINGAERAVQSAWLDYYNNRRPRRALGMKTPAGAAMAEAA